jgi:hypothetical protein
MSTYDRWKTKSPYDEPYMSSTCDECGEDLDDCTCNDNEDNDGEEAGI